MPGGCVIIAKSRFVEMDASPVERMSAWVTENRKFARGVSPGGLVIGYTVLILAFALFTGHRDYTGMWVRRGSTNLMAGKVVFLRGLLSPIRVVDLMNYHTHLEEEYANYKKPPDGADKPEWRCITQLFGTLSPWCLQTRIRPSWCCRQMGVSSVKTTSFHSAAHILLSSHHWWRRRLWFCVKGRPSNGRLADRQLCCERRRMVRADIE
ncbi:hypothetical protein TNCV_5016591 [Trichonephila clavipes]|nr:hypothetical protein TNCV_5016591 [Trichonephila clavipes]